MNIPIKPPKDARSKKKAVWIGMVEVRPLDGKSEILGDTKGAFVNIVTWASDAEEYRRNAELVIGDLETWGQEGVKKLTSADGGVCVDCAHDERVCRSSSPGFD